MADMLVLTKNQVLLLFKLAGLYGRDIQLGPELLFEILPVVGGAFFWRTTARALVGLLPPLLGLLPKTRSRTRARTSSAQMARYYYRFGRQAAAGDRPRAAQEGAAPGRATPWPACRGASNARGKFDRRLAAHQLASDVARTGAP